ncbi:hypothetical protein D9M69_689900 [compost metagenome]
MASHHLGHLADRLFQLAGGFVADALGVDAHESEHAQSDLVAVDLGPIAADDALRLQCTHPAPAGRGGQAHALRQLGVGEPRVGLKFLQDRQVELIDAFHNWPF